MIITTPRLELRRLVAADADLLFALDNDPAVMRYINGGTPTPRAVFDAELLPVLLRREDPIFGFWAAISTAQNAFIGWFSLRLKSADRCDGATAELGYRLCQEAWGQGFATEGARAMVTTAFRSTDVKRIVATTYEHNTASRRVLEKLGARLHRRFRMTPEALAASDTSHQQSPLVWDGDDVEYLLDKPGSAQTRT